MWNEDRETHLYYSNDSNYDLGHNANVHVLTRHTGSQSEDTFHWYTQQPISVFVGLHLTEQR